MNDYLVWVDTSTKIASFHEVEASDLLHFEQYEKLYELPCLPYRAGIPLPVSVTVFQIEREIKSERTREENRHDGK